MFGSIGINRFEAKEQTAWAAPWQIDSQCLRATPASDVELRDKRTLLTIPASRETERERERERYDVYIYIYIYSCVCVSLSLCFCLCVWFVHVRASRMHGTICSATKLRCTGFLE